MGSRFLFVDLNTEFLFRQPTVKATFQELEKLKRAENVQHPLDPTYDRMVSILKAEPERCISLALNTLSWILKSSRMLTPSELQVAVSVEPGLSSLDNNNVPSIETILDVCGGLVTIDKCCNTIRFSHFTVQEYLERNNLLPLDANCCTARTCLRYLSFDCFGSTCGTPELSLQRRRYYAFFEYATKNLRYHLKLCNESSTLDDLLMFCRRAGNSEAYIEAECLGQWQDNKYTYKIGQCQNPSFSHSSYAVEWKLIEYTSLHIASLLGHTAGVTRLIDGGANVSVERGGHTPLHLAAEKGEVDVARVLLIRGANPSAVSTVEQITPLHTAVYNGQEKVAKLLVEYGSNTTLTDFHGMTPLSWTVMRKKDRIVRLLIESGVDAGRKGELALHQAAQNNPRIMPFLLKNGANVNARDKDGNTPLHWAGKSLDSINAYRLLLEKGADVDATNNSGYTPLHCAVYCHDTRAIRFLLKNGANREARNSKGETPLDIAMNSSDRDQHGSKQHKIHLLSPPGVDGYVAGGGGESMDDSEDEDEEEEDEDEEDRVSEKEGMSEKEGVSEEEEEEEEGVSEEEEGISEEEEVEGVSEEEGMSKEEGVERDEIYEDEGEDVGEGGGMRGGISKEKSVSKEESVSEEGIEQDETYEDDGEGVGEEDGMSEEEAVGEEESVSEEDDVEEDEEYEDEEYEDEE